MKPLLLPALLFVASLCHAQLITKKESTTISGVIREISETHKPRNYVFRNATLITMTDSILVKDQDVLVVNGLIKAIGSDLTDVGDAIEIDATDQYLMPGLADMHVHLFEGHPMKETWTLLLLINGVTTVRDMNGQPAKLTEREKIRSNIMLAPSLLQGGPILTSMKEQFMEYVATPDQGRDAVRKQKAAGYDFIKVHDKLSKETYLAVIDEARKQGLFVAGHIPDQVNLTDALNARQQTIEHLTGYFEWKNNIEVVTTSEKEYAPLTATAGVWNCPTLFNHLMNISRQDLERELADPATSAFVPHSLMEKWKKPLENVNKQYDALSVQNFNRLKEITLNLHRSGAPVIAGTDSGNLFFLVPGVSLYKELLLLNKIGIPAYDVLKMATSNASKAMGRDNEFGVIAVGSRADLILLENNPLDDLVNLNKKKGVMFRGIYFPGDDLDLIANKIRSAFGN
jgi:imidazolonepropionase-like amidohydrolase